MLCPRNSSEKDTKFLTDIFVHEKGVEITLFTKTKISIDCKFCPISFLYREN